MIKTTGDRIALTQSRLEKAIKREQPMTLSYLEEEKDEETGKRTGRKDEAGNKILVETVRTIEPTEIRETKAGDLIVRAVDRKDGKTKSWRIDRIAAYTIHRTRFTAVDASWLKARLAVPSMVPQDVRTEMHREIWIRSTPEQRDAFRAEGREARLRMADAR